MKKAFFGLLATFLLANLGTAQEAKIISGKISSSTEMIEIPENLKSDLDFKENSSEFIIYQRFSDEFKTKITLVTDSKDKIVCVSLPTPVSAERLSHWGSRCLKSIEDFMGCCLGF